MKMQFCTFPWLKILLALILVAYVTESKAEEDDASKPGKTPTKRSTSDDKGDSENSPDDEEMEKEEEDDDGGGFGSARKAPSRSSLKRDSKGDNKSEAKSPEDRERAKLAKILEKRLGCKEEGYFVFQLTERKVKERDPDEEWEEEPPVASNQRGRRPPPFELVETSEFHVIDGRDKAVEFLVDYLSEYPPPDKKSRTRRSKDAPLELPPPQRDFRFFRSFPEGAEGNQAAQYFRDQAKAHYEEQQAKRKYGN